MAESLFVAQTPATADANDSQLYTLGTIIDCAVAGTVSAIRWFFPTTLPTGSAVIGVLYDNASTTQLARASFSGPTPGAWNTVAITPQVVTPGQRLMAAIVTPNHYVVTGSGVFPASNGANLSAQANSGRFATSDAFPASGAAGTACYFADLVFTAAGAARVPDLMPFFQ